MFIVRKKTTLPSLDSKPKAPIPTLLYGYGGFGVNQTPEYSITTNMWMNNFDAMYVVANIRGGGEFGEKWHTGGTKENK